MPSKSPRQGIQYLGAFPDYLDKGSSDNSGSHNNSSTRTALEKRAVFLKAIRDYFFKQGVIEVETPLLYRYAVSDPHIQNLSVTSSQFLAETRYLQSSPESNLKQLLAKGSGSIYQLSKVFRDDPEGSWHAQEFTMLEWYRIGLSLEQLRDDIACLLKAVGFSKQVIVESTYQQVFERSCGIDSLNCEIADLQKAVASLSEDIGDLARSNDKNMLLDLLMTHAVQPKLGKNGFEFVSDYPSDQAALAEVKENRDGVRVAKRCELFYQGVELANAYQELCDAEEFERRYHLDCAQRRELGYPIRGIDQGLLEAMRKGIPACSGVAVGVDRLLALL